MPGDFIPDDQFVPDQQPNPQPQGPVAPQGASPDFIPDSQFKPDSEAPQSSTLGAAAEGVAKGFAGPVATAAELGLSKLGVPGLSAEEQETREQQHPYAHMAGELGGTAAGLLTGVGELGLLSKGAGAVTTAIGLTKDVQEASKIARVGSAAITGMIEMAGLGAGDEVSKQILGRSEPEAPVANALANVGVSGLLGAATGGVLTLGGLGAGSALKKIGDTKAGNAIGQWLQDFGARWKFNQENPNLVDSIYNEVKAFHETTSDAASDVYGSQGLRNQAIEKLTQTVKPDQIASHIDDVKEIFDKVPKAIKSDPLVAEALMDWNTAIAQPGAKPSDVFKATDLLKRQFQEWGQYNKAFVPLSEVPFRNAAKAVGSGLKDSLEDSSVWNQAGDLQKGVNKAFSEYVKPLKDFNSKFTTKIEGVPTVDPQKIKTYVTQLSKTGADVSQEIRPTMMKNYIEASEKYRNTINDLHAVNGLESPLTNASLDVTKGSYGIKTSGGRLADDLFRGGIGHIINAGATTAGVLGAEHAGAGIFGEAAGAAAASYLADKFSGVLDKTVGRVSKDVAVPAILKVLEAGRPTAIGDALEHAGNIAKGNSLLQNGVDSLFTGAKLGGQKAYSESDEKTKDKIKKFISEGGINQQLQHSLQKTSPQNQPIVPHFAEGGMVEAPKAPEPANPNIGDSNLSAVYPSQAMLMMQAKGRVSDYLNQKRPLDETSALPFDKAEKNPEHERVYDRALNIADKPLSVLNHIQKGTLEPEHVAHMKQMWPEVYNQISKKMTERMATAKLNDEKMPPFHVRQGMAMFLGSPLDSTMTPQAIMAAQSVFAQQKLAMSSAAPGEKPKKNTSKMDKIAPRFQTGSQAAASRQIAQK